MINGKIIAIDARMIEMSGIGTYIQHLMGKGIYDYAYGVENVIRKYDKDVIVIPYEASIYTPKEQISFPNKETEQAGVNIVHFPHYNVPICYKGEFVVTVHDLTHIILPEFLGNKIKYYYAKFLMQHALKKAKHIFTVSENSKKDICEIFSIEENKVSITYNAVDSSFCEKKDYEIEYLYERYVIPKDKKILLYVGNMKPHKNLSKLLEAFSLIENKQNFRLILAGKSFASVMLEEREKQLGLDSLVIHTGMVSKEELVDLYNIADLFVFPSLYEGFGIPPLEAMACGTPVIAANNSSIPEVVGDAAILFDAKNVNDIAHAIEKGINVDVDEYRNMGFKRVGMFSWDHTVEVVKKILERV